MPTRPIKKLDDAQLEPFDADYAAGSRWELVRSRIDRDFPAGRFRFLDVGGGNGKFSDRLLAQYPHATGTVLDNSELLLSRNRPDERKAMVCESVEHLDRVEGRYDLICIHWPLHHLVGDSYAATLDNQSATLQALPTLMTPGGRVSIYEDVYEGWLHHDLPGRIIYHLASSKAIAAATRRLGANTAGVGICFRSTKRWLATIESAGLRTLDYGEPDTYSDPLKLTWRLFLNVRRTFAGHFWLGTASPRD